MRVRIEINDDYDKYFFPDRYKLSQTHPFPIGRPEFNFDWAIKFDRTEIKTGNATSFTISWWISCYCRVPIWRAVIVDWSTTRYIYTENVENAEKKLIVLLPRPTCVYYINSMSSWNRWQTSLVCPHHTRLHNCIFGYVQF